VIAYLTAIVTLVGVRALLTLGLNVQWGMTGLVNLGAVAFFAVGAYTSALLAVGGVSLVLAWPAGVALAAAAGAALALVALRLREDYLAIVTLGFAEVLRLFLLNEAWLTRGANGVTAIPRPLHAWIARAIEIVRLRQWRTRGMIADALRHLADAFQPLRPVPRSRGICDFERLQRPEVAVSQVRLAVGPTQSMIFLAWNGPCTCRPFHVNRAKSRHRSHVGPRRRHTSSSAGAPHSSVTRLSSQCTRDVAIRERAESDAGVRPRRGNACWGALAPLGVIRHQRRPHG